MKPSSRLPRSAAPLLLIASLTLAGAVRAAHVQEVAVPAFFDLSNAQPWVDLMYQGAVPKVIVIGDGILSQSNSSNACTISVQALITCLHDKGIIVLGYVTASRTIGTVNVPGGRTTNGVLHGGDGVDTNSVDEWLNNTARFPSDPPDGVFLDNAAGDTQSLSDGANILPAIDSIKRNYAGDRCAQHPCVMVNISQMRQSWLIDLPTADLQDAGIANAQAADYAIVYERPVHGKYNNQPCGNGDGQDYFSTGPLAQPAAGSSLLGFCPKPNSGSPDNCTMQSPPNWYASDSDKLGYVLRAPDLFANGSVVDPVDGGTPDHNSTNATEIGQIVTRSQDANLNSPRFLYVHDQGCTGGKGAFYGRLSQWLGTLASHFAATFTVSVSGDGYVTSREGGIDCSQSQASPHDRCTNQVPNFDNIDLTAHVVTDDFQGYTGSGTSNCTSGACMIPVNGTTGVTATFSNTPVTPVETKLTVLKSGTSTGTVFSGHGEISCGTKCTAYFLTAPVNDVGLYVMHDGPPGTTFAGWSGDCSGFVCALDMSSDHTVTANFKPVVSVTLAGAGSGFAYSSPLVSGISCPQFCGAGFTSGTTVTLTAAPLVGSHFDHYVINGVTSGCGATCSLGSLTADVAVTIFFAVNPLKTLLVTTYNSTSTVETPARSVVATDGSIDCGNESVCSHDYSPGTVVHLYLADDGPAGTNFTGWSGACSGTLTTCDVTVNDTTSVQANFTSTLGGGGGND